MKIFPMNTRNRSFSYTRNAFAVDKKMSNGHESTYLPARSRRSDTRSAGAVGSDADCREESADAAVGRGME